MQVLATVQGGQRAFGDRPEQREMQVVDVEMQDDPPTFYDVPDNISSRTLSGNYVEWDPIPVWDTSGDTYRTPDISSLVQQIVGRTGWFSGNAMVFVL